MTPEEAENMSPEKTFLHMEARLAVALDETKKKYGEDVAEFVRIMIANSMHQLMAASMAIKPPLPTHVAFCAFLETVARWNEQIDELVRK